MRNYNLSAVLLVLLVLRTHCAAAAQADLSQPLSLTQAVQVAIDHNHDVRLGGLAVDSAGAAKLIAAASPNPMLTVQSFNINPALGIGAGSLRAKTVDSAIRMDQLIERGGKRGLRIDTAVQLEDAARNDLRDSYRQLKINVAQAYYDVLAAQEKRTITLETAALYDHTVTAAQKRQKAGDIAAADVARLQVDALRAQNDVVQTEADLNRARQALALLLGKIASAGQLALTDGWPDDAFDIAVPTDSLTDQRPDVLAAKFRLDAAGTAYKQALAMRTRDVSVGVQIDHYPASPANPQGSGNSVGIALQIPLFTRNQFDGDIRSAALAVDMAQEMLAKIRDQARSELFGNWQAADTAYRRLQRYDSALLVMAKRAADAAEFAYVNGALGVMDVLDARRTYRATRLDAVAARADYAKSLATWRATISESKTQ
ncbi:TolC family protein [Actimicrobium antarcticum]|uniref:Transporter n=1 Tax=Actimicrobium antarcticum TaxID=1051899 RepID=A0ABP7T6A1_9BURK